MKKNNAFMLSYMIFLAVALLVSLIFKWDGLNSIAIGATIAGVFFAFSDLSNWKISFSSYYCDKLKNMVLLLIDTYQAELKFKNDQDEELQNTLILITPHLDKDQKIVELVDYAEETIQKNIKIKQEFNDSIKELQNQIVDIDKDKSKNRIFLIAENICTIIGFVFFFMIIAFDYFVLALTSIQTYATIIAFLVIMLNYYLKDVIEVDAKETLEALSNKAEENKAKLADLSAKFKSINLLNRAEGLVNTIKEAGRIEKSEQ